MPRRKLILTDHYPYHIYNRSNNMEYFRGAPEKTWELFLTNLQKIKEKYHCRIHSFLLMSNHYHMLLSTVGENLGEAMKYFHREMAKDGNSESGRINHYFGGRYKWCLIESENYYWNVTKYIFRNPIVAGMCHQVENYEYSSLNSPFLESDWEMVDYFHPDQVKIDLELDWLNEPFLNEHESAIAKALRRRVFKLPRCRNGARLKIDPMCRKKVTVTFC